MELTCTAILFDLDGVLINSSTVIERHWKTWAESQGVSYDRLMEVAHGRTSAEIVRLVAPQLDAEREGRLREAEEGIDTDGLEAYDSARQLLNSLPPHSWAVVTSGNPVTASTRLRFGDFPAPPVLVTADDVQRGKPQPDAYLLAAQLLGVQPARCVVIEDAPAGIAAARAAGMRTIAVATTHTRQALDQADFIVHDIARVKVTTEDSGFRVTLEPLASPETIA